MKSSLLFRYILLIFSYPRTFISTEKSLSTFSTMISVFSMLQILPCLLAHFQLFTSAQEQSQFIYNSFRGANLQLNGISKIHSNGLLELTNVSKQQIGRAFFPFPLKFNTSLANSSQSLSFSTNFAFAMVPELPTLGGHGIAFTISASLQFQGAVGAPYFGLFNSTSNGLSSNHVFAVELDTIRSPEFADINDNHVGIDVNDLTSIESTPVTYFSDEKRVNKSLELISGDPMQAWIEYDGVEKLLNVTVAPLTSRKPRLPLLSTSIDLSIVMRESMYVGFSSSTGSMASHRYILGWSFNKSGKAQSLDVSILPSVPAKPNSGKKQNLRIIVPSVTTTVAFLSILIVVYILRKKRYEELREDWEQEYGPQRFSYRDLYKATKGFKDKEMVGIGGFGRVYRGVLCSSNTQIAVKKISHDSRQGMKEFVAEIATMGRVRHRNLVQLLGYCRRRGELLLVYDYMPNGSLNYFLFNNEAPNLNWGQRCHILRDVAAALLYLHEEWEQVVLHRDVKASNILLDAELNGRLGDFGLAKFYDRGANPRTTCIVGTVGYLASEVARTGRPTTSSDVFAFGTLMLETACGRQAIEVECPPEEIILVDWVFDCLRRGDILGTCDPRLEGNYPEEEMEMVLKLGLFCACPTAAGRPSMRQVVQYLEGNAPLPEIPMDVGNIGLVTFNNDTLSTDVILSISRSNGFSGDSLSSTDSILGHGR